MKNNLLLLLTCNLKHYSKINEMISNLHLKASMNLGNIILSQLALIVNYKSLQKKFTNMWWKVDTCWKPRSRVKALNRSHSIIRPLNCLFTVVQVLYSTISQHNDSPMSFRDSHAPSTRHTRVHRYSPFDIRSNISEWAKSDLSYL